MHSQITLGPAEKKLIYIHVVDAALTDDDPLIQAFRYEGFECRYSTTADHYLAALESRVPDVCVINLHLGKYGGAALVQRTIEANRSAICIMLDDGGSVAEAVAAMKAGAADVYPRLNATEPLISLVLECLRQKVRFGTRPNGKKVVQIGGFSALTNRERQVLQSIANGQSTKDAAVELGISERTVELYRTRVRSKLGASNTADLMRIVLTDP